MPYFLRSWYHGCLRSFRVLRCPLCHFYMFGFLAQNLMFVKRNSIQTCPFTVDSDDGWILKFINKTVHVFFLFDFLDEKRAGSVFQFHDVTYRPTAFSVFDLSIIFSSKVDDS